MYVQIGRSWFTLWALQKMWIQAGLNLILSYYRDINLLSTISKRLDLSCSVCFSAEADRNSLRVDQMVDTGISQLSIIRKQDGFTYFHQSEQTRCHLFVTEKVSEISYFLKTTTLLQPLSSLFWEFSANECEREECWHLILRILPYLLTWSISGILICTKTQIFLFVNPMFCHLCLE